MSNKRISALTEGTPGAGSFFVFDDEDGTKKVSFGTFFGDCIYHTARWLRFSASNHKALVIKAGTWIKKLNGEYEMYDEDTLVDLSAYISAGGTDYFVYLANDGTITASDQSDVSSAKKIGRFHTLCANAGTMTMIAPPSGIDVGSKYLIKGYREEEDPDFFAFYNKAVTASDSSKETMAHPLSGYLAGDILPESVFCLSWHPNALVDDAMVYDKDTDTCVDIYLQSGTGLNTRSKYGATHTVSRQQGNHMSDMRMVGKTLISDAEFESASIGSNQATNITGSSDKTTVGGHVDTANRRMISAIGCEEMCGYLNQWTRDVASTGGSSWATTDGNGSFGQEYGTPYILLAGGYWSNGSSCGSRCRSSLNVRSLVYDSLGGRGVSHIIRGR